jgi:ATP-dependent Clp protease ATP-binding subunit ClpC
LRGIKERYEEHHNLTISEEALSSAATLAARYIPDRFLPDKAIDLVDEAASRVRIKHRTMPITLKEAKQLGDSIRKDKDAALATQQYDYAAELRERELQIDEKIKALEEEWRSEQEQEKPEVVAEDIAEVVSMWTGVPVVQMAGDETSRLLNMEEVMHQRIIGQNEAIDTIAKAIRRARAGLKDPRRPIGNFIFLGPTGVGKTELARTLAEFMFGSEDTLIRIDMSEFMEKFAVSRLVGAPPGYVGYDEGGQLTEAVRRKSYSCILLDEIEKAHPDVFNLLLQIFDDGHLTDAKGRRVDFRNSIIIMTSNIGAELIRKGTTIGFASRSDEAKTREQSYERMKENLLNELKKAFRPEFLNRVDGVVVFHSLSKEQIRSIVDLMLASVSQQLKEKEIMLEVTGEAKDLLGEKGYDEVFGARPLRRVIQDMIEDRLSEAVLRDEFKVFDRVFETKTTIKKPEAVSGIVGAIREIPGVLNIEESGGNIKVFSNSSIKFDVEKIAKDQIKELMKDEREDSLKSKEILEPRVSESTYISYVVVDVKDGEITIDSKENYVLPDMAVGAAK